MPSVFNLLSVASMYNIYDSTNVKMEFILALEKLGYTKLLAADLWELIDYTIDQVTETYNVKD